MDPGSRAGSEYPDRGCKSCRLIGRKASTEERAWRNVFMEQARVPLRHKPLMKTRSLLGDMYRVIEGGIRKSGLVLLQMNNIKLALTKGGELL
jgi:hypothetical protein